MEAQKPVAEHKKENKRAAVNSQIDDLEKQISGTKYNKRTEGAIGLMKAKLAKLKEKAANRGKGQKKGDGFSVRKSGDASVVLLGFPSVGKSTLLNSLTNANSATAAYAFTTLTCIPGTLDYRGAKIQILDVPGIVEGAANGSGRGKEVLQVVRSADLVLIVIDVFFPEHHAKIIKEINEVGVRINQQKPNVRITRTFRGGVDVGFTVPLTKLDVNTIQEIMREMGYINASIVLREDINADQLIDVIEDNKVYIPAVTIVNKIDMATKEQIDYISKNLPIDAYVSAKEKDHMDELKELIFNRLKFIRIYMKEIGKKADMVVPLILQSPCTLRKICERLHRDFVTKFKFARIWGTSVHYEGQKVVKLDHVVNDKDIVELHLK